MLNRIIFVFCTYVGVFYGSNIEKALAKKDIFIVLFSTISLKIQCIPEKKNITQQQIEWENKENSFSIFYEFFLLITMWSRFHTTLVFGAIFSLSFYACFSF
jgi:hypothetical protein